jgi:hypothetical protein
LIGGSSSVRLRRARGLRGAGSNEVGMSAGVSRRQVDGKIVGQTSAGQQHGKCGSKAQDHV